MLVNGSAPFVTDGAQLSVDSRLAGQDEGGLSGRYLELVRAQVTGAYPAPVSAVSRTVALLGGSFIAVVDEVAASSSASVSMPFHGRGVRGAASGTSPVKTGWTQQGVALDYAAVATQPLSVTAVAGHTTLGFGHEEAIDGITVNAAGAQVRVLSLFSVRAATSTAASVEDRSAGDALALRVTAGAVVDHLSSAARGSPTSVDGAVTDASFSALREESGALTAFAFSAATRLTWGGAALLQSDRPLTASVSLHPAGLLAELSPDQAGASSFKLGGLALAAGVGVRGFFNGVALTSAALHADDGGLTLDNLARGGTLRVEAGARLLDAVPPQTVSEGSALTFTLTGTPPAGGALTFSMSVNFALPASNLPALDPQTGVFSWTPGASIASHTGPRDLLFTFFAESGGFIAAQPCQIRVLDVNQPPSVQTPAAQSVQRGGTLKVAIAGTDPDGDALTWSFTSAPAFASPGPVLGAATGALDWAAPLDAPLGTFSLTITASDGALSATAPLALTVLPAAPAPVARSGCGGCAGGAGGLQAVLLLALWWPERRRQPRRAP